jgi:flagellar FliL protein
MRKLIPVILILLGIGGGLGAGLALRPVPEAEEVTDLAEPRPALPANLEIGVFEIPNQFMVPLIVEDRIASVLILTVALEINEAQRATVSTDLPRLRDAMLQVMFDHANSGGFSGAFTANTTLSALRRALLEAGQKISGQDVIVKVLITDILRSGA